MRLLRLALLMFVALAAGTPSQAGYFISGNDLKGYCDKGSHSCGGYILGVVDMISFEAEKPGSVRQICLPEGVAATQLVDIAKRYLEDNPDKRHWSAPILVWNAMAAHFYCGKKS